MTKALSGVKVLDFTRAMAGPLSTMFLGDMGADVIKIEEPKGDETRRSHPKVGGVSTMFQSVNRNKRSIVADLKDAVDIDLIKQLVAMADVIVENYRPGVMDRLGLGYEVLNEINPQIIFASCSGFGQTGPYKNLPAYDIVVQAYGGLMSMTGPEGGGSTKAGFSFGDIVASLFTATGILAALLERVASGKGQRIDVAMQDCQIAISENAVARYLAEGIVPEPIGNRHPSIAPNDAFSASDGKIMIVAGNDKLWDKLCVSLQRNDLSKDDRFRSNADRALNHEALKYEIEKTLSLKTVDQWAEVLHKQGVPYGKICGYESIVNDPDIQSMIQEIPVPGSEEIAKMPGFPILFSRTPCAVYRRPPSLGEHQEEVREIAKDGWT